MHVTVLNTVDNCKYHNIIILRGHCHICGPLLTETSLCSAWLYMFQLRISLKGDAYIYMVIVICIRVMFGMALLLVEWNFLTYVTYMPAIMSVRRQTSVSINTTVLLL